MKKQRTLWSLVGIIVLASILRLYALGIVPPSLNWDEAAWGYNAYTLGIDGRDEFGVLLPYKYLESFGDFKPPLYAYTAVIPVKLFGLDAFAVRLPSAIFGILTVILSYFLVKQLFYNAKHKELYALFTAFLLAISPWHIMLSRAAFEANLVTFLIVLGVWLFLKGISGRGYFLILSVIPFAASFYTFNTARIVTPLIGLLLVLSFWKILFTKQRKELILAAVLGVLLVAPLVPFLLSPQASLRFQEVNIFSDIKIIEQSNTAILRDNNALWSKLLHHRYALYGVSFVNHYLDHFKPDFLFIKGDGNPKFSTQDVGQLFLFEIPFFIAGIILLFRKKEGYWWIIPLWLLIGIIPAATARETPHALRIESTLPMFQILSAIGLTWFVMTLKKFSPLVRMSSFVLLGIIVVMSISYFLHGYYVHYSREYSGEWQYGYKESIAYVSQEVGKYDEVQVSDILGRPYVYYLLHTQTDPEIFRNGAKVERDAFGFVHVQSFGKYVFPEDMDFSKPETKKILYITSPQEVPTGAKVLKKFSLLNGDTQLVAFTR